MVIFIFNCRTGRKIGVLDFLFQYVTIVAYKMKNERVKQSMLPTQRKSIDKYCYLQTTTV